MELPPIDPTSAAKPLSPTHRVNSPSGEGRQSREVPPRPSSQGPTPRTNQVSNTQSAPSRVELLEQALPIQILKDPSLTRTEWAWRRLLLEQGATQASTPFETSPPEAATTASEQAVQYLRTLLTSLSDVNEGDGQVMMPFQPPAAVFPFNAVSTLEQLNRLPDKAKRWVVQDRLVSSVRDTSVSKSGSGLFFPTAVPSFEYSDQVGSSQRGWPAIRWRAEAQTRVSGQGKHVNRVTLDICVHDSPVQVTVVSSNPALYVHISAGEQSLVRRLDEAAEALRRKLNGLGWQVDGLSIGLLKSEGESS